MKKLRETRNYEEGEASRGQEVEENDEGE